MGTDCANFTKGCAKGLLMSLNGLSFFLAMTLFTFAVVDTRILRQYDDDLTTGTLAANVVIMVTSVVMAGVAVFGCLGAAKEHAKILYFYVIMLIVLILLELLLGIYVAVERYGLEFKVTEWIREDFYSNSTTEEHQKTWNRLQMRYECCGLNGPRDYAGEQQSISLSCCAGAYRTRNEQVQAQMYKTCIQYGTYFKMGCEEQLLYRIRVNGDTWLALAYFTFLFEIFGMLLAMWIANNLKRNMKAHKIMVKY